MDTIDSLRTRFPVGQRVRFIDTGDPYTHLAPESLGTVTFVDDTGTVHVKWDDGSWLGMIPGLDHVIPVEGEPPAADWMQTRRLFRLFRFLVLGAPDWLVGRELELILQDQETRDAKP